MKIRKLLPLVLLAIASVFLLSSCDALLDAIFANDTINVYVSAAIATHGPYPSYDTVDITVTGPTSATATAAYTGSDGYYMYWSVAIPKLSDGNYTVQASFTYFNGAAYFLAPAQYAYPTLPTGSGSHSVNVSFNF
ncbi:MAG: hypothetical protein ABSG17_24035 [Spirochaetia bacterium]|jgi:hypothetical protein